MLFHHFDRLNEIMGGNDTRIQLAREVFDALLVDKPVLPFMTEQDFLNAKVPVGLARHLANAIAALK